MAQFKHNLFPGSEHFLSRHGPCFVQGILFVDSPFAASVPVFSSLHGLFTHFVDEAQTKFSKCAGIELNKPP